MLASPCAARILRRLALGTRFYTSTADGLPRDAPWMSEESKEVVNNPEMWYRARMKAPVLYERDTDREACEDPEGYQRRLLEEVSSGEAYREEHGLADFSTDPDLPLVESIREDQLALKAFLEKKGREAAVESGESSEAVVLSKKERFALEVATYLSTAPDDVLLVYTKSKDAALKYGAQFNAAAGLATVHRYEEALRELDKLLPFLGDYWKANEISRTVGLSNLPKTMTHRELEAQFFSLRGACWFHVGNLERAERDMVLALDLYSLVKNKEEFRVRQGTFEALLNLAGVYLTRGKYNEVLATTDLCLEYEKDEPSVYDLKMKACKMMGHLDDAARYEEVLIEKLELSKRVQGDLGVLGATEETQRPTSLRYPNPDAPIEPQHRLRPPTKEETDMVALLQERRKQRAALTERKYKAIT